MLQSFNGEGPGIGHAVKYAEYSADANVHPPPQTDGASGGGTRAGSLGWRSIVVVCAALGIAGWLVWRGPSASSPTTACYDWPRYANGGGDFGGASARYDPRRSQT